MFAAVIKQCVHLIRDGTGMPGEDGWRGKVQLSWWKVSLLDGLARRILQGKGVLVGCAGGGKLAMCFLIKLKRKADIKQRFSRHSLVPRLLWENITMPKLFVIYQAAIKAEKGLLLTEVTLCRKSPCIFFIFSNASKQDLGKTYLVLLLVWVET